jgi:hypothetical protein
VRYVTRRADVGSCVIKTLRGDHRIGNKLYINFRQTDNDVGSVRLVQNSSCEYSDDILGCVVQL